VYVLKTVMINDLEIGVKSSVRIMGVINLSPESFYNGSIKIGPGNILQAAIRQVKEGADIIDLGAKSTAPYLETEITPEAETDRALKGLEIILNEVSKPISIDTTQASVAEAAINAGAKLINDISGFHIDSKIAEIAREYDVPVIIGAYDINRFTGNPTEKVIQALRSSLDIAEKVKLDVGKIIVDPDIGFHRIKDFKWYKIDAHILMNLQKLIKAFDLPVCIGLSRKSFIGKILDIKEPKNRLYGSLGATSIAVLHGANIIRTHDVRETLESIRVIEKIKEFAFEEC
jgi:dihydropteroate synthase